MSYAFDRLKTALADRYTIERELGAGGMATVYLAHDLKHDRKVAVKVLRPELAAVLGAERFLNEIKVTANLQHPHILPLHDSGKADSRTAGQSDSVPPEFLYYVMPYMAGESLRDKLNREKQLPIDESLTIASQVADALGSAHRQGVVHRDTKPENILLREGHAVVADFGIALAVTSAGGDRLTETGLSLGTPACMSPEQVAGDREIDGRSDIYSLACVLYEMLAGDPPFVASSPRAVLAKHVTDPAPPITTVRSSVPRPVAVGIAKALSKAPADRFDSAKAFSESLFSKAKKVEPEIKSIVVLPFENLSPDPDNEYFADGLTEELIAELSGVRALRVISRTTAMKLKGADKDVATISRELNVQYVLEGSVRKAGNALRITAQLIDANQDAHLWADRYSGNMDDVFEIQERLSREIVDQLRVSLSPEEDRRIAKRPINDLVAYDCYLRAKREYIRGTEEGVDRAVVLLEKALAIEGPNELLFATLGTAHLFYWMPLPLRQDETLLDQADVYAEKVFALNPDSPHGHALRGMALFMNGSLAEAAAHLKEAHRLAPNNADALFGLTGLAVFGGHLDTARSYYEKLSAVEPWSGINPNWIDCFSGLFDAAVEGYRKEYEVDPTSPYTRWAHAHTLAMSGRADEAREIFELVKRDTPETMYGRFADAYSCGLRGNAEGALRAMTPELLAAAKPHWQMRWIVASLYALIGRENEALDWLELAVTHGFYNYIFLEREPFLKRLHTNPRFRTIVDEARRRSEALEP